MDSALLSVGLPLALAVIMFGLGLTLTPADFTRVARQPRPVGVALAVQILLLPLVALALALVLDLDPLLAVGLMLLAAAPGGTTANLFSHLFGGDVALNLSLTAVNSVIAALTLPLVVNLSLGYFDPPGAAGIGLQLAATAQVFAIVLVPVAVGMLVRRRAAGLAARADRPVRIASALCLAGVTLAALLAEREDLGDYLVRVGPASVLLCSVALGLGYAVPRLLGLDHPQSVAATFEVGLQNSTLAIAVAVSVIGIEALAVPAAIYGVLMFPLALVAGILLSRSRVRSGATTT